MKYDDKIKFLIEIVNVELLRLDQLPIFSNPDFMTVGVTHPKYLKVLFRKKEHISFDISFSLIGIEIGVDRIPEAFFIGTKNTEDITNTISMIFLSQVVVNYWGSRCTEISFYNNNLEVHKLTYFKNAIFNFRCARNTKRYLPIVSS